MVAQEHSPLRQHRRARGWSRAELARRVGCSASLIYRLETGARRPGRFAAALAAVLELPERELFPPPPPPPAWPPARWVPVLTLGRAVLVPLRGLPADVAERVPIGGDRPCSAAVRLAAALSSVLREGAVLYLDYGQQEPEPGGLYLVIAKGHAQFRCRVRTGWRHPGRRRGISERDGRDDVAVVARVVAASIDFTRLPAAPATPDPTWPRRLAA